MNIKENAHYQKTDMDIRNLVIDLLQKKLIHKISVTAICQRLKINRSTFYEHYKDVYAVVEQAEHEMAKEMGERFSEKLKLSRKDAFLEIFRFVYAHKDFYAMYVQQGKSIHFLDEVTFDMLHESNHPLAKKVDFLSEVEYHYHIAYFRSGINALIRCWLERDCLETPEKLFSILSQEYQMFRIIDAEKFDKCNDRPKF